MVLKFLKALRHKRALSRDFLLIMIIAIISFIIILMVVDQFFNRLNPTAREEICRSSVLARINAVIKYRETRISPHVIPIICDTQHRVLRGSKEDVLRQISDMTARCWWMFLNGEYANVFDDSSIKSEIKCFNCYSFYIQEDINITYNELYFYMSTQYYIDNKDGTGVTYMDYIQSHGGPGAFHFRPELILEGSRRKQLDKLYFVTFVSPDITWFADYSREFAFLLNPWISSRVGDQFSQQLKMNRILIDVYDYKNLGSESNNLLKQCGKIIERE